MGIPGGALRQCLRCKAPRQVVKQRLPGARCTRRVCVECGGRCVRIKGARKVLPAPLQRHKELDAEALALWKRGVRLLRGPSCNCGCGRTEKEAVMHPHHIFSRTFWQTRHVIENGAWLAAGCHARIQPDHEANRSLGILLMGAEGYERMNWLAHSRGRLDLALVIVALRGQIARLEGR